MILSQRHNVNPPTIIDTMSVNESQDNPSFGIQIVAFFPRSTVLVLAIVVGIMFDNFNNYVGNFRMRLFSDFFWPLMLIHYLLLKDLYILFIVNELVRNYEQGNVTVQKCNCCGFEKEMHSNGVHETKGGLLRCMLKNLLVQTIVEMNQKIKYYMKYSFWVTELQMIWHCCKLLFSE